MVDNVVVMQQFLSALTIGVYILFQGPLSGRRSGIYFNICIFHFDNFLKRIDCCKIPEFNVKVFL